MVKVHQIPNQGVSPLPPPPHSLALGYQSSVSSNVNCTRVTWASRYHADPDLVGKGMAAESVRLPSCQSR